MFDQRCAELRERLIDRGYRKKMVDNAIIKVKELRRQDILERVVRTDKNSNQARAVFRYDRRLPDISTILKKNWRTMTSDDTRLLKVFPHPPMVFFNRGKNPREKVYQAKLPPLRSPRQPEDGFKRCGRSRCRLCPYTNHRLGQVLKSGTISNTGEELLIRGSITCTTKNILYIGTCSKGDRTCAGRPQHCGEAERRREILEGWGTAYPTLCSPQ